MSQSAPKTAGPEWRRTSEGWIKVGSLGAAGLDAGNPRAVQDPALHPAAVAAFMLLTGVLFLGWFEPAVVAVRQCEPR